MSPHNRSVAVLFALNSTEQMFVLDVLLDHVLFQKNRNTCMYIIIVDNFRTEHVTILAMFSRELHSTTKPYKGAEYSNFVRLGSILDIFKNNCGVS